MLGEAASVKTAQTCRARCDANAQRQKVGGVQPLSSALRCMVCDYMQTDCQKHAARQCVPHL